MDRRSMRRPVDTLHKRAVQALLERDPELKTSGMRQAVKARFAWPDNWEELPEGTCDDWPGIAPWDDLERSLHFIPDAWKIVGEELHCYEVVDTSGMTRRRRAAYGWAWDAFDSADGTIRLFVVDPHGSTYEANLERFFFVDYINQLAESRGYAETL